MAYIIDYGNFNDQRHHNKIDLSKYTLIEFARKIADKLGYELITYIDSGAYGAAFKITKFRVLKLTTDVREVYTAKKLIGKNPEHIVNYYDVKKIESPFLKSELYAIVLDYVFSITEGNIKNKKFFDYFTFNYEHLKEFFKNLDFNSDYIDIFIDRYKDWSKNDVLPDQQIEKNIQELKQIAIEANELDIYPLDIHSGNFGYKFVNCNLVYFDVGMNKNYKIIPIDTIKIS